MNRAREGRAWIKESLKEALSRGNLPVIKFALFHENRMPEAELRRELADFAAQATSSAVLEVIQLIEHQAEHKHLEASKLEQKLGPSKKSADLRKEQEALNSLVRRLASVNPEIKAALKAAILKDEPEAA